MDIVFRVDFKLEIEWGLVATFYPFANFRVTSFGAFPLHSCHFPKEKEGLCMSIFNVMNPSS